MDKFGKICQHHWKERYKISKIAKFENEISQMFVWWGAQTCPPTYKQPKIFVILRSYILAHLRYITFKFGKFTNCKVLFSVVLTDFLRTFPYKKLKKLWKGL